MIAGEHFSGSAKSRGNFIGNEQQAKLIRQFPNPFKITGRLRNHPGGALHHRFQNDGGYFSMVAGYQILKRIQTLILAVLLVWTAKTIGLGASNVGKSKS